MNEQVDKYLYNPVFGKATAIIIGVVFIWNLIKLIQRNLFSQILNQIGATNGEIKFASAAFQLVEVQ